MLSVQHLLQTQYNAELFNIICSYLFIYRLQQKTTSISTLWVRSCSQLSASRWIKRILQDMVKMNTLSNTSFKTQNFISQADIDMRRQMTRVSTFVGRFALFATASIGLLGHGFLHRRRKSQHIWQSTTSLCVNQQLTTADKTFLI